MSFSQQSFDFIVVGAGPSGCLAASTLANSKKRPSVLLIEAGGKNDNRSARIDGERWITKMIPEQNWSYKTIPQTAMGDRVVDYDRGKGLGGSSAINFCCYIVAPADDHDEIARQTGDDEWSWKNAQERYKRIETYYGHQPYIPDGMEGYLSPDASDHGNSGPIKLGFPAVWEKSFAKEIDAFKKAGHSPNLDINNGNNLGVGVVPSTAFQGVRSTAADALRSAPTNLQLLTDSQVARIIFEKDSATGVRLADGTNITASKEVILCAGAIDSPKILLHSGIGPAEQLRKFNIPIIDENEAIGENLHDHPFLFMSFPRHQDVSGRMAYYRDPAAQAKAREQWEKDCTGPLAEFACQVATNFSKNEAISSSPEFQSLPQDCQRFLQQPGVPMYEHMLNLPNLDALQDPQNATFAAWFACFLMNPMSRGRIYLQSADPLEPAAIDMNMLSHPYDLKLAIEATRALQQAADTEPDARVDGAHYLQPKSYTEDSILEFWRTNCIPTWHATGSVKMGKDVKEAGTCVDKDFKVRNVDHLRVADLSVVPLVTNNHTQSTAYLVGIMLGDRLVTEYGLDK